MKKILLGTSALVAAAALAAPASAADKIKLKLGGYWTGAAAFVDLEEADVENDIVFGSDAEVHFGGKTTLDNGLQVGFKAELELAEDNAGGNSDIIDEVYGEVKGGFGKIQFGE
ncbi:MAG: porin, partial [Pseudomonadota bacterium]